MSRRKWLLLILGILLVAGYWKFFYKTYSETAVAKNVDCIFALDVKRVTNTIIWNTLTTPSLWKKISFSSGKKFSWKKMVEIPDYVFVFHAKGQPANAWYAVLEIKDMEDFSKGLIFYHFEKKDSLPGGTAYFSKDLGIDIIQSGNKVLLGNNAVEDKRYIRQVALEMFIQKQFITRDHLFKNVAASSHLSIQVEKNDFLAQNGIIQLNFDKEKISMNASLHPKKQFTFTENKFTYTKDALCSMGFTQPSASFYPSIPDTIKTKISKAVNFNIDSLLLQTNQYYNLNITGITARVDSAISYSYDDNFNQVQKVVVNNVMEPSFNFSVHGDSVSKIYNYWSRTGQLEQTTAGMLFVPMPFVKSYCSRKNEKELSVASAGFQNLSQVNSTNCIFFLKILLTKLPPDLLKYFPSDLVKLITNAASIEISLRKDDEGIRLQAKCKKKENALLLIEW